MTDGMQEPARLRTYACEDLVFATRADADELAVVVDSLLDGFTRTAAEPALVYELRSPRPPGGDQLWTLTVVPPPLGGEQAEVRVPTMHHLIDALVDRLDRDVLHATPGRLHVHGGAVRHGERVAVALGPSRAGKSTLVATLVRAGAGYLSDEMLSLAMVDDEVSFSWVPKPIGVRHDAAERLVPDRASGATAVVRGLDVVHMGPSALGSAPVPPAPATGLRPGLVVVLQRVATAPARFEPMHPADVAVTLLEQSFDGNRLGPPALEVAARLSASSRCGALVYREATDAAAIVVAELDALDALGTPDAHGATAVAVDVHEVPAATAHVGGAPARSRATSSTWIGDRVVVLHGPARRVVALDPVTSSLWALFDGTTTTTELADELADESSGDATVIAARLDATVADLVHHDLVELPEGRSAR